MLVIEEENPNWRDLYWEACGVLAPGQVEGFLTSLPEQLEDQSPDIEITRLGPGIRRDERNLGKWLGG